MGTVLPFVRRPERRPLEGVRQRVVGGWDVLEFAFDDSGLTPADRVAVALAEGAQVLEFRRVDAHPVTS